MAVTTLPEGSLPKNYRLIYDIVQTSGLGRHLTMSDVFARAAEQRPGIGYSTVYRGLVRLRQLGMISEIGVPGADSATYEPVGPNHAHVRCVACGSIEDVGYTLPSRVLKSVADETGFAIDSGDVTFAGRCASCRAE
ncbi:MAG: transcriptional repressor [Candidatus Eremiobacteraeota bacterium]|nr:transcriptional repressor [Candidatus Eremiobacteraeota bacterium]